MLLWRNRKFVLVEKVHPSIFLSIYHIYGSFFMSPTNHRDKQRFVPHSDTKWLIKHRDFAQG